jgi:ankyrin repeat protein
MWTSLPYFTLPWFPRTPLHAAAFADNVSGLRMLLQHQAEVNAADHTGHTALMTAAENGQTAAVGV